MVTRRIRYRIWQFFTMVRSSFQPVDIEYVKAKLPSPSLLALFTRMPRMEQNHGVSVCKALEQQGEYPPELLTAALLHDVGKVKIPDEVLNKPARLTPEEREIIQKHTTPKTG